MVGRIDSGGQVCWRMLARRSAAAIRSAEKRESFAIIVARAAGSKAPREEAKAARRLSTALEDVHLKILATSEAAPACTEPFDLLQVVALRPLQSQASNWVQPLQIRDVLSNYTGHAISAACVKFLFHGLLHDEGEGR